MYRCPRAPPGQDLGQDFRQDQCTPPPSPERTWEQRRGVFPSSPVDRQNENITFPSYYVDRTAYGVLDTLRSVCLLRSRRRTFLFEIIINFVVITINLNY